MVHWLWWLPSTAMNNFKSFLRFLWSVHLHTFSCKWENCQSFSTPRLNVSIINGKEKYFSFFFTFILFLRFFFFANWISLLKLNTQILELCFKWIVFSILSWCAILDKPKTTSTLWLYPSFLATWIFADLFQVSNIYHI